MGDPTLIPWWQLPIPPPASIVVVRDIAATGPAQWTYFIQPIATVLAIGGAFIVAQLQAKNALAVANKNAEIHLEAATRTSEATINAALEKIRADEAARRSADELVETREAADRERRDEALRKHIRGLFRSAFLIVSTEAHSPDYSDDQEERAMVLRRFVDAAYNIDLAGAFSSYSLDRLYTAAQIFESALRLISNVGKSELTKDDRDHLARIYVDVLEKASSCATAIGITGFSEFATATIASAKSRHPDIWPVQTT
jgi:hypothetical protein